MELTRTEDGNRLVLAVTGKCTVENAAALRQGLLEAVGEGRPLVLDISGVEEADISFLQLLLATALTLDRDGRKFDRRGPVAEAALHAARVAGFNNTPLLQPFFADGERNG
ncbi:anti-sigma-factor antagonist [Solidesulfovibrio fructosivorans JJ]]|uniref:Anti-sigma-factor antagonist n=1 Tax=Solidesulfovibrio fructosivorans JJ] TaxID=596151 RepID=E1K2E6_SOLFR|nr:STAS domain-containing protein [Solidesulfovibrio fructosivorans]EFL49203.1 anti-sigma-factor antagonist [Solidesulfovibrio fructosivorans JJ]]